MSSSQRAALSHIVRLLSGKLPKTVLRLLIPQIYTLTETCQKVSLRNVQRESRPALRNATNTSDRNDKTGVSQARSCLIILAERLGV